MFHRWLSKIMILVLTCSLTACGGPGELPDEPYEAVSYRLYPAPEDAYVGDTMPFVTDDGTLELYYLYDTDHNGMGYHPVWKYSTKDLCSYEDHGQVLDFGLMSDPDPAIGTGSVMQDQDGLYHLFYTGHNDTGNGGKGRECVMHATSTDRENWVKIPEDTFYSPDNYSKDDFRDPEVFWVDEEQCYWMLIAARENIEGGVVARYTSKDLRNWEFQGPLFAPRAQYMLECPDLFRMGDTWYLTYSWDCVTYYAMADSMYGARPVGLFSGRRCLPVGGKPSEPPAAAERGRQARRSGAGDLCGLLYGGKAFPGSQEGRKGQNQEQHYLALSGRGELCSGGHGDTRADHDAGMRRDAGSGRARRIRFWRKSGGRDLYSAVPGRGTWMCTLRRI